jgi:hypothetical protein
MKGEQNRLAKGSGTIIIDIMAGRPEKVCPRQLRQVDGG